MLASVETPAGAEEEPIDFARDIRPILSNSCYACHGPDRQGQENDLRLDRRAAATEAAIVPGSAEASALIARISSDDPDLRMPPATSSREPLTDDQIALLKRWIDEGAAYTEHWAYTPPRRPPLPAVRDRHWPTQAIDHFILAQNDRRDVPQSPDADPATLIRRLHFDLLGLPPSPEDVRRFVADTSPGAYPQYVERLLESGHFGERMAIVWLDLVRFADTCGYHGDQHRNIDAYRDYVIASFNENKPFDRFTIEQLAGDLLPQATQEQLIATAFHRLLQTTEEGGAQPKEYRAIYQADRVRNIGAAYLGSTLGCAQCHDHKFDAFTLQDFYSFAAFFADVDEVAVGRQPEKLDLPTDEQRRALQAIDDQIAALQGGPATGASTAGSAASAGGSQLASDGESVALKALKQRRDELQQQIRRTLVTEAIEPRMTRILPRGNWLDESGPVVQPAIPAVFGHAGFGDARGTRLDLAQWLVSPDNPLTSRVFVNHLWRILFGNGIVRTPDDFGSQGQYPTHPQLLDWLAVEFRESGWDVKHMIRLMVQSRTYRQASTSPAVQAQDPDNRWFARQTRFRLDAEMVRDNALAVSGLLVPQIGGRSVKPYQPAGYWDQLNFPKRTYVADEGADQYRRGLYTYWCRTFLHPSMVAFDAPTREECTVKRTRSNTPLQALVLLNDPSYVEAAHAFGRQIMECGGADPGEKIEWALFRTLARAPSDAERAVLGDVYHRQRDRYQNDPAAAAKLLAVGQGSVGDELRTNKDVLAEWAAWTSVARVLLNLHETISRS
jgi:hypothetical protein